MEDIHRTIAALVNDTKYVDSAAIQYGAGVYIYNDFAIKSTYIEDTRNFYGIEVKCTDFKNQNAASTDLINWYVMKVVFQPFSNILLRNLQYFLCCTFGYV